MQIRHHDVLQAVREDSVSEVKLLGQLGPFQGEVVHCRSWTSGVHIRLTNGDAGWIEEDTQLVAIASAAQASGKPVYIKYDHYDPQWGNGAGHFFGVKMALLGDSF